MCIRDRCMNANEQVSEVSHIFDCHIMKNVFLDKSLSFGRCVHKNVDPPPYILFYANQQYSERPVRNLNCYE